MPKAKKLFERRFVGELRAAGTDVGGAPGANYLEGYAAKFDSPTVIGGMFREVIKPGAFTRAISEKQDVRALVNHNPDRVMGRTKNSTLSLSEDSVGLRFRCMLPDTQDARDLYTLVKRGDISQCSFAFIAQEQTWRDEETGNDDWLSVREIRDVDLMDISMVTVPAYEDTSVSARALFPEGEPPEIRSAIYDLKEKRQKEAKEKREDDCWEDVIDDICIAISGKFGYNCYCVETYDDYVIVCCYDQGAFNYSKLSYSIDGDGNVTLGDSLQPVEAAWVPAERTSKRAKMSSVAAQMAQDCNSSMGNCENERCLCQNRWVDPLDVWEDGDDDEYMDDDDGRAKKAKYLEERAAKIEARFTDEGVEKRDGKVLTKRVSGKNLTKDKFAYVGDPEKTTTWKLPIHDASHVRNALARFDQTDLPTNAKAGAWRKITAAAKKFGIEVSEDKGKAESEAIELEAKLFESIL